MTEDVVNITCDRGHPTKVAGVAAFMRSPGERWSMQGPAEVDPRRRRAVPRVGSMVWIDQTPEGPRRQAAPGPRSGDRRSYSLPCPVCGLNVSVRDDRLQALLTRFHEGAEQLGRVFTDDDAPEHLRVRVSSLPLAVLAAIVNGS